MATIIICQDVEECLPIYQSAPWSMICSIQWKLIYLKRNSLPSNACIYDAIYVKKMYCITFWFRRRRLVPQLIGISSLQSLTLESLGVAE